MFNIFLPYLFEFHDSSMNVVDWQVYVPADGETINDVKDKALQFCRFYGYYNVAIFRSKLPGEPSDLFVTDLDAEDG